MSERYSRLFALPENLYTVGSPVIIAAGTLLKDTQTGKIIAQLKLKNISPKAIKAVKVKLDLFDTAGKPLEESVVYDYLDLNVSRDIEFGQKNPVVVPNTKTRSYRASVAEVVFVDRSLYTGSEGNWEPLSKPSRLEFQDYELQRQYEIKFGGGSVYETKAEKDLWHCTCGALNHDGEICHICHNSLSALQALDMSTLEKEKDARLAEEARVASEKAREAAAKQAAAKQAQKRTAKYIKIAVTTVCSLIAIVLLVTKIFIPNRKYNDAVELMNAGQYDDAINAFEALDGYKDSTEKISDCHTAILDGEYYDAIAIMDTGNYDKAIAAFEALGGYKDSRNKISDCETAILDEKYNNAISLVDTGNAIEAFESFLDLGEYKDSSQKATSIYRQYEIAALNAANSGDYIFFGSYEQDNDLTNGKEYTEWLVLDKQDDQLLLISKYALDCKQYNTIKRAVTWETCTLRTWLNKNFLNEAFDAEEQSWIPTVTLSEYENRSTNIQSDSEIQDKVFLLSIDEANRYFSSNESRICLATNYAQSQGASAFPDNSIIWWLRSRGYSSKFAADVYCYGNVNDSGEVVSYNRHAVRPAIWIDLDAIDTIAP